jgi:hypothetical protein
MTHAAPLIAWSLVLAGLASGLLLGLFFRNEEFLGGYASFRRRLVRLGHVACVALGRLLLEVARAQATSGTPPAPPAIVAWFAAGSLLMPLVCFLTAWRPAFRFAFVVPVGSLIGPVVALLVHIARQGTPGVAP